jgi:hypothetical protein
MIACQPGAALQSRPTRPDPWRSVTDAVGLDGFKPFFGPSKWTSTAEAA